MKRIITNILFTITILFGSFLGYSSVYAYNTSLVSSSTSVSQGQEFTITIKLSGLTNGLASASYNVSFDDSLFEYVSLTKVKSVTQANLSGSTVKIAYYDAEGGSDPLDNGTFATLKFKAKTGLSSDTTGQFSLSSAGGADKDNNSITSTNSGTSVKVHIISTNNNLSDLKIDGTTISGFSKDKTSYEIDTTKASVSLTASLEDSASTITGTGTKTLSYGKNTFSITVKSESGSTKTYTVVINRQDTRNDDTSLKSIAITGYGFGYKKNVYEYDMTINAEYINVEVTKNDSTQSVTGNIGRIKLNYGANSLKITVTSEKGSKQTYTLRIVRNDTRSGNNYLSSLSLSTGNINFKQATTSYSVTVDNSVSSVTINATLADSKASFVSGYGPRTVKLSSGNTQALIKVKNQKDEIRVYTINISKNDGKDTNADLEYLKISEGTIDFNKNTTSYKITVENSVDKISIDTKAVSTKAKISINNPTLSVGENTVKITVTAENGAVKEYIITVIKKEKEAVLSTDNYLSSITIEGYTINFDKDILQYDLTIKDEEVLIIDAYPSNQNSSVTITGNESLKDGSIITINVISESGDSRTYQINIHKETTAVDSNKSIPTQYIIVGLLGVVLVVLIIIIVLQKKKKEGNFIDDSVGSNGINNVYNKQSNNKTNDTQNSSAQNNKFNNTMSINPLNTSIVEPKQQVSQPQIVQNAQQQTQQQSQPQQNQQAPQSNNNVPYHKPVNNPSGLTKVCSSCGRRVPYEAGTCPYCMNDF